jgi:polar amino acid transport system substrate-binding protein
MGISLNTVVRKEFPKVFTKVMEDTIIVDKQRSFSMKIVITILFLVLATPLYALDLTVYTEEFPPFNYTQQGKVTGVSTEVVEKMFATTEFKITIKSLPWSDTYERAQKEKNALIYSISRNKNREPLFKWIGIVTPTTYSVKALTPRKDIKIDRLEDMKRYRIGTNVDDVMEQWLLGKGFELSNFSRTTGKYSVVQNFKNLLNKKIDVWPAPDAVAYYIAREQGHSNPDALMKSVFKIEELSGGYYLAGSRQTSDSVIAALNSALLKFKKTDEYYKILAHWGVDAMGLETTEPLIKLIYALKHLVRVLKVGYLANDNLSSHEEGGFYRKALREPLLEMYAKDFDEWKRNFVALQDQVDVIIIGDVFHIDNWQKDQATAFVQHMTRKPTGYLLDGMEQLALIGYDGDDLTVNMKIAKQGGINIPKAIKRKAIRIIE